MADQRTPVRRAAAGIGSEPAEKNNVGEALDHVLHEVLAARRDLSMTRFCLQQAEAVRRIDRAATTLADLMQSGNRINKDPPAYQPFQREEA